MKKTIFLTLVTLLFMSCGGDSSKDNSSSSSSSTKKEEKSSGVSDVFKGVSSMKNMAEVVEEMQKEGEKLLKATPMSNAEMKKLLPETLIGYPRKKFSVGNGAMVGLMQGEAEYEVDERKRANIKLSIIDGAGEAGSAYVNLIRLEVARDFESEDESGYQKSTTIRGYKAIEDVEIYRDNTNSEFRMVVANRFLVKVNGRAVEVAKVKKAIDELDFKTLESLAR